MRYDIIHPVVGAIASAAFLGVAQLVARYLGVVEAASSSLVTQTISSVLNQPESWVRTLDFFLPFCASLYV